MDVWMNATVVNPEPFVLFIPPMPYFEYPDVFGKEVRQTDIGAIRLLFGSRGYGLAGLCLTEDLSVSRVSWSDDHGRFLSDPEVWFPSVEVMNGFHRSFYGNPLFSDPLFWSQSSGPESYDRFGEVLKVHLAECDVLWPGWRETCFFETWFQHVYSYPDGFA